MAIVGLAGSHIENRRVGRGEREVADGGVGLLVKDGLPGVASVDGLEDSAGGGADIHDARVRFDHGEVVDSSAHGGGADVTEFQILQHGFVPGLGEGGAGKRTDTTRALADFMNGIPEWMTF